MGLSTKIGRRIAVLVAAVALASGTLASGAQAAPTPVAFGTVSASPKAQSGDCPTAVTLSTTVKVKAPVTLKYAWTFSDGDRSRARTYKVGGKGLKTVRLSTSLKVTGDARGWGAVRLAGPVRKTSGKAAFSVTCTGDGTGTGDTWDSVTTSAVGVGDTPAGSPTPAPTGQDGETPAQNLVGKATIAFERTTASKCPVTFKIHGSFEGLPAGAQTVQYRVVGTQEWKTVNVPADHGTVFTTVLETFEWGWETEESSIRIEVNQPDGLRSNVIHYFKCHPPVGGAQVGVAAEDIALTGNGGPLAELVADAMLEAVQSLSGAQAALVSKYGMRKGLQAGPIKYEDLYGIQPAGFAVDVRTVTGAQLKKFLVPTSPNAGVATPSAALRYTLKDGVVTGLTLNGTPVSDTQVLKIAINYQMSGGWQGFPQWQGTSGVYYGGPDDTGALASYIANHSPVQAPAGDRVTVQ